jgi:hypothetical protein
LLFREALGPSYEAMPEAIRNGHAAERRLVLAGRARIEGARNAFGWGLARLFGFPRAAEDIPVHVVMTAAGGREAWARVFGNNRFGSELTKAPGRGRIFERFGAVRILLEVTADAEGMRIRSLGAYLGSLRLPDWLVPRSDATERLDADGRFTFDVPISMPFAGQLVRYRGWLVPQAQH